MTIAFPFMWDELLNQLLLSVTGSPLLVGLIGIFFISILGMALRLTLEIQLIAMFFYVMLIAVNYIPWLTGFGMIAAGIFIGLFLFYTLFRG